MAKTKEYFMKRGQEIIAPERMGRWEECVDIRLGDLYEGWDLDAALDIIEKLNADCSFAEAKKMIEDQNHSGSSYAITLSIIDTFSERGEEFRKYSRDVDMGIIKPEPVQEKPAVEYKEVECYGWGNLDEVVQKLQFLESVGFHVKTTFNGVELCSDTVTLNSAYEAIVGCTKDEFDRRIEELKIEEERKKSEFEQKKPELIKDAQEKGAKLIAPELVSDWNAYVEKSFDGLYQGMDVNATIEILEAINNGAEWDEVKKIFDGQGHSGMSAGLVGSLVEKFSGHDGARSYLAYDGPEPSDIGDGHNTPVIGDN